MTQHEHSFRATLVPVSLLSAASSSRRHCVSSHASLGISISELPDSGSILLPRSAPTFATSRLRRDGPGPEAALMPGSLDESPVETQAELEAHASLRLSARSAGDSESRRSY
eukprot:957585-Rhodomonas_salina.4